MPDDSKFDEFLRREMTRPVDDVTPPADEIWSAIELEVARAIKPAARPSRRPSPWLVIGAAIAATLLVGIVMGRWSASPPAPVAPVAVAPTAAPATDDSARAATQARASAYQHLAEVEVFLTAVRADLSAGRRDADRAARSRELLARTRLLLGSGESRSPAIELLLEDLELLLAEISALPDSARPLDRELLNDRLRRGTVLPRIRTTLPARTAGL